MGLICLIYDLIMGLMCFDEKFNHVFDIRFNDLFGVFDVRFSNGFDVFDIHVRFSDGFDKRFSDVFDISDGFGVFVKVSLIVVSWVRCGT